MEAKILYPSASALDIHPRSEREVRLYLIPAEESDSGLPEVTYHSGVGNIGTPAMAWHKRWLGLGAVQGCAVGQSVLDVLRAHEDALLELAATYQGSRWDGSNHIGYWAQADEYSYDPPLLERALSEDVEQYWDAADWLYESPWDSVCRDCGIDPERGEGAIDELAEAIEGKAACGGAHISRTREVLTDLLQAWMDARSEEAEEA